MQDYQTRMERLKKTGKIQKKFEIPETLYGDFKTKVDRLKKSEGNWSQNRGIVEGMRLFLKKYSK